ncbi:MAG: homoserine kinase [bacterium]|nr:homoserine kinase [bacterium]
MQKIKICLPATITNFGPGVQSLGLAVGLYVTVEISGRKDDALKLDMKGEGADHLTSPLKHPVVLGVERFFQTIEKTHLGINIRVENQIPLNSGLGAESAMMLAGILGANFLMGEVYTWADLLEIAADLIQPDRVVTAIHGGLTASLLHEGELTYRSLPAAALKVIVIVPQIEPYSPPELPERVLLSAALHNLQRMPLFIEALRLGDLKLLARMMDDRLSLPQRSGAIPGYEAVVATARRMGALAVSLSGEGPTMIAFAENRQERIADEMRLTLRDAGIMARTWVLPVDTQGIVFSIMQSA